MFGIVGQDYTPLQNREAFQFFDPIVGEGAAVYHTAGALGKGERVWILAKLQADIQVVDGDITHKYLLLSNSHAGDGCVQIKFTPVRVVCQNTLNLALSKGPVIRVSHVRDLKERLGYARENLGIIHSGYAAIETAFKLLASIEVDDKRLSEYLKRVFPDPRLSENKSVWERVIRTRKGAADMFEHGRGNQLKGVAGTLWAAYNGVAELIDHGKTRRTPDQRLNHIWFGDGAGVKARAFNQACEYIEPQDRP